MSFITVLMAVCLLINVVLLIRGAALGYEDRFITICAAVGGASCSLWWIGYIASQSLH